MQRKDGKPVSHQFAKELLAGFVGGEVDKLAETKGMDFVDKERAQHRAKKGEPIRPGYKLDGRPLADLTW